MMTIKHITAIGEEFVYPTSHVNFVPANAKCAAPATDSVWRYDEEGRAYEMRDGRVYVMNEHGTTVARYDMSSDVNPEFNARAIGKIVPGYSV